MRERGREFWHLMAVLTVTVWNEFCFHEDSAQL